MKLVKIASSTALILFLSGCSVSNFDSFSRTTKPKVDASIEVVDVNSIKTISDINAIAFEWNKVKDPRVVGYNFYRGEATLNDKKLKHISLVNNRHTTHFVDTNVKENTKYIYKISSHTKDGIESNTSQLVYASTLPALEKISFVQSLSDLPRQIKLVWRPHSNPKVEKYEIEQLNTRTKKYERIATVKGRLQVEYIHTGLGDNEKHTYKVKAVTFDGIKSLGSEPVIAKTKPLPLTVNNIKVSNNLPKKITISWDSSTTSDVKKYNVYRSSYESLGYSLLKTVNSNIQSISDIIEADGKEYYYKITSVDVDNLESKHSKAVMGSTLVKPKAPFISLGQIQDGRAILNWKAGDERAVSYNIYKRTKLSLFEYKTTKFTNVKALRFEDQREMEKGKEFTYSIQAVDKFGLVSKKSEPTTLTISKGN